MAMLKGLKHFWVAKQIQDNINGVKFETPKLITGLNKVGVKRKSSKDTYYADDQPWETAISRDATEIEVTLAELTLADQAFILGHTKNGAEMTPNAGDVAPVLAVGFECTKSNGKTKCYWFYGCQFEVSDDDHESSGQSVKLKPETIKATSMPLKFNGDFERVLDEEDPAYTTGAKEDFFKNPVKSTTATTPTNP